MSFTPAAAKSKAIIDGFEITSDTLTGRSGLSLFARYLRSIQIFQQIDIAAKIVRHGGRAVLKVTAATFEALNFEVLWQRSGAPPRYCWS